MYSVAIILAEAPASFRTLKIFDSFNGSSILNFSIEENIEDIINEHIKKYYKIVSRKGDAFILEPRG